MKKPVAYLMSLLAVGTLSCDSQQPEPEPVTRFDYDLPVDHVIESFQGRHIMALSPDGRRFVYETTDGLYLRPMDELEALWQEAKFETS